MMFEPNAIVLYVNHLATTSRFYQDLLEIKPKEHSPSFNSFTLSNGMDLGLKVKDTVEPAADKNGCYGGELAFTVESHNKVDELFAQWQKKGVNILMPPTVETYGYTFLALDPDGTRLRVVALGKPSF